MKTPKTEKLLDDFIEKYGETELARILSEKMSGDNSNEDVLTIIANQALHKIPAEHLHGEVYVASEGNVNFVQGADLNHELLKILQPLKHKLREKSWKRVHLVPTGHPVIALQIKNLVYHVLRLNTIDLCYLQGHYYDIEIKRESLLD